MEIQRRQLLHLAAGAVALPAVSRIASAQVFPSRPITMIVPFAAGGPTDVVARVMTERMKMSLGQSIIIENVSGADGSIAVGRVARAPPGGYTIVFGAWTTHVLNGAIYALRYDLVDDFEPIALISTVPFVLYAKKTLPAIDLNELIAWLKANPEKASHGTVSAGSHAVAALFQKETGTPLARVAQPHASPTREARPVKLCNAPATNHTVGSGQAFEPRPAAAEVAFCPYDRDLQLDNPRFSGAGRASAVDQYDGVRLGEDEDLARRCTVPEPLFNETQSRSQPVLSLQLSNINRIEVLANVVFGISAAERHFSLHVRPDDDIAQPLTPTRE